MTIADEILKSIQYALDKYTVKCDRTYKSVVKEITPKGYIILDNTGCERTVSCSIPDVGLTVGKGVWIKVPCGNLNQIHICGVQ